MFVYVCSCVCVCVLFCSRTSPEHSSPATHASFCPLLCLFFAVLLRLTLSLSLCLPTCVRVYVCFSTPLHTCPLTLQRFAALFGCIGREPCVPHMPHLTHPTHPANPATTYATPRHTTPHHTQIGALVLSLSLIALISLLSLSLSLCTLATYRKRKKTQQAEFLGSSVHTF